MNLFNPHLGDMNMTRIYNGRNEQDVRETLISLGVTILVGAHGSGKTSTVATIIKEFEGMGISSNFSTQEVKRMLKVKDNKFAIFHCSKQDHYQQHGLSIRDSGLKQHFISLMEEFKPDINQAHQPKAIVVLDGAENLPEWSDFVKGGEFRTVLGSARSMGIQVVVVLSEGTRGNHFITTNARTLAVFKSSENGYNYYNVKEEDRELIKNAGDYFVKKFF